MPSLQSVDDRFGTRLQVLEGGSGFVTGVVSEPSQGEVPAYAFNLPRRLLRLPTSTPVKAGMVLQAPSGTVFMVGDHGDSEGHGSGVFRSFRLFEASGKFSWKKRGKSVDPVTRLPLDTGLVDQPEIWGTYEPSPEMFDRQLRSSFESARFITTADVKRDDVVNDMKVSRVDLQLGIRLVTLG